MGGHETELLIVPTAHLSAETSDKAVEGARQRLISWAPDLVAVEALPGYLVAEYERQGGPFADCAVGGAPQARQAAALVGAGPEEVSEGRRTAVDSSASVHDRVMGWCRAREPLNALLLPWQGAVLPAELREFLRELEGEARETVRICAYVARSLGHEVLAHVDDHTGVENRHLLPNFAEIWRAHLDRVQPLINRLDVPEQIDDLWQLWRQFDTPEAGELSERLESAEWTAGDGANTEQRVILANWRARNLAMAARLRSATAMAPGGRVVFVVGLAHLQPIRRALERDQYDLKLVRLNEL